MALINCPECSKEISSTVKKCPHCGYKIPKAKVVKEKNPKTKKIILISICSILGILLMIGLGYVLTQNGRTYKSAKALFDSGNFEDACTIFTELGDYKDSSTQVSECCYQIATSDFNDKKFSDAINKFTELGDYKDSAEQVKECKYQIALVSYEKEKYEEALKEFQEISDYKESKKYIDDCNYQISVDIQFIRDLSKGLVSRWKISGSTEGLDEKELDKKLVNSELDIIGKYGDMQFTDKELEGKAKEYIEALNKQLEAIPYYNADYTKYNKLWSEGYNKRAILLDEFVAKYNLAVEEKYKTNLQDFVDTSKALKEQEELRAKIKEMLDCEITLVSNDYGWKEYRFEITNTTDNTFSDFGVEVKLYNEEGTYVGSCYTNSISDFKSGDKAILSFSTTEDFANYELIEEWYVY